MNKNYYAVTVKFGHVGKNKFIFKTVPVFADDGRDAAEKARWYGRAKHHAKDAIMSVTKINEEQYVLLLEEKQKDPYFHCKNIQQQRLECIGLEDQIQSNQLEIDMDERKFARKMRIHHQQKKYKNEFNEYCYIKNHNYELYAY